MITKKGKKRVGVEDNSHVEIRALARKSILSALRETLEQTRNIQNVY